jgi:hypothetical protein
MQIFFTAKQKSNAGKKRFCHEPLKQSKKHNLDLTMDRKQQQKD